MADCGEDHGRLQTVTSAGGARQLLARSRVPQFGPRPPGLRRHLEPRCGRRPRPTSGRCDRETLRPPVARAPGPRSADERRAAGLAPVADVSVGHHPDMRPSGRSAPVPGVPGGAEDPAQTRASWCRQQSVQPRGGRSRPRVRGCADDYREPSGAVVRSQHRDPPCDRRDHRRDR